MAALGEAPRGRTRERLSLTCGRTRRRGSIAGTYPRPAGRDWSPVRFPRIVAHDLDGQRYELPSDLPRGPRIVMLAFQRWHTGPLARWQIPLERLAAGRPDATLWEVPALSRLYAPARPYIDGGMRAGIPDPEARKHTLTSYTDLRALASDLDLPTFETVYVFLLDGDGEIAWRASGEPDDRLLAGFTAALETIPSPSGAGS
jgi:hypothetical protein